MFLYAFIVRFILNLKRKPVINTKEDFLNYLFSTTGKNWKYSYPLSYGCWLSGFDIQSTPYTFSNMYLTFVYEITVDGYLQDRVTKTLVSNKFKFDFTKEDFEQIHLWFYKNYYPDLYQSLLERSKPSETM